jgi:hypothetical protein
MISPRLLYLTALLLAPAVTCRVAESADPAKPPALRVQEEVVADLPIPRGDLAYAYDVSADEAHLAVSVKQGDRASMWMDGKTGPAFTKVYERADGARPTYVTFSPDGSRSAYAASRDGKFFVVVDGEPGTGYAGIQETIAFSADSRHVAHSAQIGERWHVVVDGKPGPAYDYVQTFRFAPDGRLAVLAGIGPKSVLVIDGKEASAVDIPADDLYGGEISPDLSRAVWFRGAEAGMEGILDGKPIPVVKTVSSLAFSADGRRLVFRADRTGAATGWTKVFVDGVPSAAFREVDDLTLSPDGAHVAFSAEWSETDGGAVRRGVVHDGARKVWNSVVRGSLVFSADGKRFAYGAYTEPTAAQPVLTVAVVDGEEGPRFAGTLAELCFSPDGSHVAYSITERPSISTPASGRVVLDGVALAASVGVNAVHFTPDGSHLVWVAREAGGLAVKAVRVGAGKDARVATAPLSADKPITGRVAFPSARTGQFLALQGQTLVRCRFEIGPD